MSKRVVTYSRVSTEEQAKSGSSLESQREACAKYAQEQGWMVIAEIEDAGVSGATFDRPGLDRIRDMAQEGQLDALIVYDLDRLSRKAVYQMVLEEELGKAEVTIHSVLGNYEDRDEGRLMKTIKAGIAEYERAKIKERMNRGKRTKAHRGEVASGGNTAYGYRNNGNRQLVIEEREAEVVRLIFELFTNSEDVSISEIARRLTASPHHTSTGKKKWYACSVSNILKNQTYAGCLHYNKVRRKNEYSKKRVARPKEEWIAIPVPAIVSQAAFECAQRRLERNRKFKRRQPRHPYLLSGMLVCAECGRAYSGAFSGGYGYYRDGGEKHLSLRADQVEEDVWTAVKQLLLNPSTLWEAHEARESQVDQKVKLAERLEHQLKLKAKAEEKLDRLTQKLIDPDIMMPKAEYIRCRQPILRDIEHYDQKVLELQERLDAEAITQVQVDVIEDFTAKVSEGIDQLGFEDKRSILRLLEVQGLVHQEDGETWIELEGVFMPTPIIVSQGVFCHPFTY